MISAHRVGRLDEVALVALLVCRVLVQEVRGACLGASMMRFISCCAGIFSRYRPSLVALVQLVELGATDVSQARSLVRTKRLQSPPLHASHEQVRNPEREVAGAILAGAAVPPEVHERHDVSMPRFQIHSEAPSVSRPG
jgi:hypothetical protein